MNDTNQNEPTPPIQQPETEPSPQPFRPIELPIVPPKPKWYEHKVLWIVLAIVVLLGGAAGTGYAYYTATKSAESVSTVATEAPKPSPSVTPKTYAPYALLYSSEKQVTIRGTDCGVAETTVYQKPVSGGDAVSALAVPDYQVVSQPKASHDNHVILTTTPSCYSKKGPGLWLSKDAGASYSQLYEGAPQPKENFGEQISSALMADNGKSIVFATVNDPNGKGVVKSLDISSKKVTDMFSINDPGINIQGYDQKGKKIYYYGGCYNCAGNSLSKPIVHDLEKNTDTPLFEDKEYMSYVSVMNRDLTKILRVKFKGEQIPQVDLTYVIEEFDINTKKASVVATFMRNNESGTVSAGYTANGSIYYTNDKDLFVVTDGKPAPALRAPLPILAVHHMDKERAIFSQGEFSGGGVVRFTLKDKASTTLLDYKYPTAVHGISLQ